MLVISSFFPTLKKEDIVNNFFILCLWIWQKRNNYSKISSRNFSAIIFTNYFYVDIFTYTHHKQGAILHLTWRLYLTEALQGFYWISSSTSALQYFPVFNQWIVVLMDISNYIPHQRTIVTHIKIYLSHAVTCTGFWNKVLRIAQEA